MKPCRYGYRPVVDDTLCAMSQANGNCHEKATCGSTVEKAKLKAHVPEARAPRARAEERRRGRAPLKDRCKRGHVIDRNRTRYGKPYPVCRTCERAAAKRYRERKKQ